MFASHFNGTSQTSTPNTASSSAVAMSCGAGRQQLVGYSEQWQVCKPRNAPISDGFAMTVADAVTGPGSTATSSRQPTARRTTSPALAHLRAGETWASTPLVCGEDPTNIENGRVVLIPHGG